MDESKEPRFAAWQKWVTFGVAVALCMGVASMFGGDEEPRRAPAFKTTDPVASERLRRLEQRVDMLEAQRFDFDADGAPVKAGVVR